MTPSIASVTARPATPRASRSQAVTVEASIEPEGEAVEERCRVNGAAQPAEGTFQAGASGDPEGADDAEREVTRQTPAPRPGSTSGCSSSRRSPGRPLGRRRRHAGSAPPPRPCGSASSQEAQDRRRAEAERQQPEEEPVGKAASEQPSPPRRSSSNASTPHSKPRTRWTPRRAPRSPRIWAVGSARPATSRGARCPRPDPPALARRRSPGDRHTGRALRRLFYARRCDDGAVRRDERKERPDDPPRRGRRPRSRCGRSSSASWSSCSAWAVVSMGHAAVRLRRHLPRARLRGAGTSPSCG